MQLSGSPDLLIYMFKKPNSSSLSVFMNKHTDIIAFNSVCVRVCVCVFVLRVDGIDEIARIYSDSLLCEFFPCPSLKSEMIWAARHKNLNMTQTAGKLRSLFLTLIFTFRQVTSLRVYLSLKGQ